MTQENKKYANIIVDVNHESVDRPFCYRVPGKMQDEICVGMQVMIPFGRGNTLRKGFVTELLAAADYPEEKIKDIDRILQVGVVAEGRLTALAAWIRQQYGSTFISALKTVLPVKEQVKSAVKRKIFARAPKEELAAAYEEAKKRKHVAKARLLSALLDRDGLDYGFVVR